MQGCFILIPVPEPCDDLFRVFRVISKRKYGFWMNLFITSRPAVRSDHLLSLDCVEPQNQLYERFPFHLRSCRIHRNKCPKNQWAIFYFFKVFSSDPIYFLRIFEYYESLLWVLCIILNRHRHPRPDKFLRECRSYRSDHLLPVNCFKLHGQGSSHSIFLYLKNSSNS